MKSFSKIAAQGELTIRRIDGIPAGTSCKPMVTVDGKFIVGHSETGHHHVIGARGATVVELERPPEGMKVLYAILENPISLDHLRTHDTHESIMLEPGTYEIRVAREFDHYAELARQSQD